MVSIPALSAVGVTIVSEREVSEAVRVELG